MRSCTIWPRVLLSLKPKMQPTIENETRALCPTNQYQLYFLWSVSNIVDKWPESVAYHYCIDAVYGMFVVVIHDIIAPRKQLLDKFVFVHVDEMIYRIFLKLLSYVINILKACKTRASIALPATPWNDWDCSVWRRVNAKIQFFEAFIFEYSRWCEVEPSSWIIRSRIFRVWNGIVTSVTRFQARWQ